MLVGVIFLLITYHLIISIQQFLLHNFHLTTFLTFILTLSPALTGARRLLLRHFCDATLHKHRYNSVADKCFVRRHNAAPLQQFF